MPRRKPHLDRSSTYGASVDADVDGLSDGAGRSTRNGEPDDREVDATLERLLDENAEVLRRLGRLDAPTS
jgi:hypothetical protein